MILPLFRMQHGGVLHFCALQALVVQHVDLYYCIFQNNLDSISLYVLNIFLLDILGNRQHQFVRKSRTASLKDR